MEQETRLFENSLILLSYNIRQQQTASAGVCSSIRAVLGNSQFLLSRSHFENSAGGELGSTIFAPL